MYLKRDGVRSVLLGGLEKLCGAGWSCTSQAWYVLLTTRVFGDGVIAGGRSGWAARGINTVDGSTMGREPDRVLVC